MIYGHKNYPDKVESALTLSKAISFAADMFNGRMDKNGVPYILHCLEVMNKVAEVEAQEHIVNYRMTIAVLHDVLEDCEGISPEHMEALFGKDIVTDLKLLTREEDMSYDEYIDRICASGDVDVMLVKRMDLHHNSDLDRFKGTREKDFDRHRKYAVAYQKVKTSILRRMYGGY